MSNGALGGCCSTFCLQFEGQETGYCQEKPNSGGSSNKTTNATGGNAGLVIGVCFAVLAILALLIAVIILLRRLKTEMLTKADIYRFLRGAPDQGGLDLPIHERVDILPYDASYEILPAKFTIGNFITGAFN